MKPNGSQIAIALLVVATGVLLWLTHTYDVPTRDASMADSAPLTFAPLSDEVLEPSRNHLLTPGIDLSEEDALVGTLLGAWERLRIGTMAGATAKSPELHTRLQSDFATAAQAVVITHGPEGYAAVCELAYRQFLLGLEQQHAAARPVADIPQGHAAALSSVLVAEAWRRAYRIGVYVGDFATVAKVEGLLDEAGGVLPGKDALVHLLFRYLWAQLGTEVIPLYKSMTGEEILFLRRWQIEVSRMPLEKKLALIQELRGHMTAYDLDVAEATLRVQSGDREGADATLSAAIDAARAKNDDERVSLLETKRRGVPK